MKNIIRILINQKAYLNMKGQSYLAAALAIIFVLAYGLSVQKSAPLLQQWSQWKQQYGVHIGLHDDLYRMLIFQKNLRIISEHNAKADQTYQLGINQFAHLSSQQFFYMYASKRDFDNEVKIEAEKVQQGQEVGDVDWEKLGMVSPVANQGQCDAGYAFCSTSLGESYLLLRQRNYTLSNQQIIDCAADYTTMGCSGGSRSGTLKFLQEKGVLYEHLYPYTGKQGSCLKTNSDFKLTKDLTEAEGCYQIKTALSKSPLTVAVNIRGWQLYKSGIFYDCDTDVQHDIFLVGVSETYWKLKNSWGNKWGENGYIRIGAENTCGICEKPAYGFK